MRSTGVKNVIQLTMTSNPAPFVQLGRLGTCPRPVATTGGGTGVISQPASPTGSETDRPSLAERQKSASNTRKPDAEMVTAVPASMPALCVVAPKVMMPVKNVKNSTTSTEFVLPEFLVHNYWEQMLPKVYQPAQADELLRAVMHGVAIGRPPATTSISSPNWPSAYQFRDKVDQVITDDLALGRLYGPFDKSPFPAEIISPLGAFLKRDKVKVRLIHDLSFPHGRSVNSAIDPEEFSLHYSSIDSAVEACGRIDFPILANIDLKDAYKSVGVRLEDWHLLGLSWEFPGRGTQLLFSRVLSFGLRSAPALFDRFASALELFMRHEGVTSEIVRYVDDFLVIASSPEHASRDVDLMVQVSRAAGFVIQSDKVTPPTRVIQFLGIVIDLDNNILRISDDRVAEIKALLSEWVQVKSAPKRKLLRLVGKLAFAARVVRSGRAFIGRLIGLSKSVRPLHHHLRLSQPARRDIEWWQKCLESHNGVSTLRVDWSGQSVLHVYSDASGTGFGALLEEEWFAMTYTGAMAPLLAQSINWRELHVAVKSIATWGPRLAGRYVIFHIDNSAAGCIISRMYSPIPDLMELLRQWALLVEHHSVQVRVEYISTHDNLLADLLSRGDLNRFAGLHGPPSSQIWPAPIPYYDSVV